MRLYLPPCYKKLELQVLFSLRRQMTTMLSLYRLAYRSLGPRMKLKASKYPSLVSLGERLDCEIANTSRVTGEKQEYTVTNFMHVPGLWLACPRI